MTYNFIDERIERLNYVTSRNERINVIRCFIKRKKSIRSTFLLLILLLISFAGNILRSTCVLLSEKVYLAHWFNFWVSLWEERIRTWKKSITHKYSCIFRTDRVFCMKMKRPFSNGMSLNLVVNFYRSNVKKSKVQLIVLLKTYS